MDPLYRKRYLIGLLISLVTTVMGLINPFLSAELVDEVIVNHNVDPMLRLLIGDATEELEKLPLHRDERIIKNILYSGVWSKYELAQSRKEKRKEKHGG